MLRLLLPALALPGLLLMGCASTPGSTRPDGIAAYADDPRLGEPVDRICFASNISGFSMNTRRSVVLHEGRKHYMVEVFGACPDLEYAQSIGVSSVTGCVTIGDSLIIGSTFGPESIGSRRCSIKEIRAWDPRAEAAEETEEKDPGT